MYRHWVSVYEHEDDMSPFGQFYYHWHEVENIAEPVMYDIIISHNWEID